MAEKQKQSRPALLRCSSLEAYLGMIIAIVLSAFRLTWWLTALAIVVACGLIIDLAIRHEWMSRRPWTVKALVGLIGCASILWIGSPAAVQRYLDAHPAKAADATAPGFRVRCKAADLPELPQFPLVTLRGSGQIRFNIEAEPQRGLPGQRAELCSLTNLGEAGYDGVVMYATVHDRAVYDRGERSPVVSHLSATAGHIEAGEGRSFYVASAYPMAVDLIFGGTVRTSLRKQALRKVPLDYGPSAAVEIPLNP